MKKYLSQTGIMLRAVKSSFFLPVQIIKPNHTLISIFPTIIGSTLFQIKYSLHQVFLQTVQHTG